MKWAPVLLVCMGVSGSGKTTLARALAERFELHFIDADDHHGEENRARMAAGKPLDDTLREPWIQALCEALREPLRRDQSCVMAYSGLRRAHRQRFRELGFSTQFLHLTCDPALIRERMAERTGHFMPAGLLESQLAALETTESEPDIVDLDVSGPLPGLIDRASDLARQALGLSRSWR